MAPWFHQHIRTMIQSRLEHRMHIFQGTVRCYIGTSIQGIHGPLHTPTLIIVYTHVVRVVRLEISGKNARIFFCRAFPFSLPTISAFVCFFIRSFSYVFLAPVHCTL